jgi:putative NIF3 family GTP cyclohydrolase 1 type 2
MHFLPATALLTLPLLLAPPARAQPAAPSAPTAQAIVERIQRQVACPRRIADTVDTFKAGDPDRPVTGIATTFAATQDVLARAAAAGRNLIIAHEPTFYDHREDTKAIEGDAVLAEKRAFLNKHGLRVWRFHDLVHCRRPDGIQEGMIEALGWQKQQRPGAPPTFVLPAVSLRALATDLRRKLKASAVRVVGQLDARVTKIGFLPGAADASDQIRFLARPDVEVLVTGESREWETVEYVRDAVAQGRAKALILLGHVPSEESGMKAAARWLKSFIPEVPVEFLPAGDPFAPLE